MTTLQALLTSNSSGILSTLLSFLPDRRDWEHVTLTCRDIHQPYRYLVVRLQAAMPPWPTVLHPHSFQIIDVSPCQRFVLGADTDGTLCVLHQRHGVLTTMNVFDTPQYQNSVFAHPNNPWRTRRLLQCQFQKPTTTETQQQQLPTIVLRSNRSEIHLYEFGHPFDPGVHDLPTQRGNFGIAVSIGGFSLRACLSSCGCYVAMRQRRGIYKDGLHPALWKYNADYAQELQSMMDTLESWNDEDAHVTFPGERGGHYRILRLHPKVPSVSPELEISIRESTLYVREIVVTESGRCVLYNPSISLYRFVRRVDPIMDGNSEDTTTTTETTTTTQCDTASLPKAFQHAMLNQDGSLIVRAGLRSRVAAFFHTQDVVYASSFSGDEDHGALPISEFAVPDGYRFSYVPVSFPHTPSSPLPSSSSCDKRNSSSLGYAVIGLTHKHDGPYQATHVLLVDIATGHAVQSYGPMDLSNSRFLLSIDGRVCHMLSSHRSHPSRGLEMVRMPGAPNGNSSMSSTVDILADPPTTISPYDYRFEELGDY